MIDALLLTLVLTTTDRSTAVRRAFVKQVPCPSTGEKKLPCKGFVIDHFVPLACGGLDTVDNMTWMAEAEALNKDKWERKECAALKAIESANGGRALRQGVVPRASSP